MVDIAYWVDTFLSTPAEGVTTILMLAVVSLAAGLVPNHRDTAEVAAIVFVGTIVLSLAGPEIYSEWHYWGGVGVVGITAVTVLEDALRAP